MSILKKEDKYQVRNGSYDSNWYDSMNFNWASFSLLLKKSLVRFLARNNLYLVNTLKTVDREFQIAS